VGDAVSTPERILRAAEDVLRRSGPGLFFRLHPDPRGWRAAEAGAHGLEGRATREAVMWHGLPAREACTLGQRIERK
jgi:hypothetical protein